MDFFWLFWGILGIGLLVVVLCFFQPPFRAVAINFMFYVCTEIKGFFYYLQERVFGPVPNISVRHIPIDAAVVNMPKNGWSFADCPATVWVRRKVNNTLEVEVGQFNEKCMWYCWPSVDFCVGRRSGRIKKLIIKYRHIRNRGVLFRNSCEKTEWAKYFTSVVLAHMEVLKFSQRKRSHHPTLIGRIFKHYGENFFIEVV